MGLTVSTLIAVNRAIVSCARCPRLRAYCRHVAVRGAAPGRLCESVSFRGARRWLETRRLLHRGGGAVRAARQQAQSRRAGTVPAIPRGGSPTPGAGARGGHVGPRGARELAQGGGMVGAARAG